MSTGLGLAKCHHCGHSHHIESMDYRAPAIGETSVGNPPPGQWVYVCASCDRKLKASREKRRWRKVAA